MKMMEVSELAIHTCPAVCMIAVYMMMVVALQFYILTVAMQSMSIVNMPVFGENFGTDSQVNFENVPLRTMVTMIVSVELAVALAVAPAMNRTMALQITNEMDADDFAPEALTHK